MNTIAKAIAATSSEAHSTESGCGRHARTTGSMPIAPATVTAMTAPTVSLSTMVNAPAKRAVPDIQCWLESSLTALVSIRPGNNTTSEAMITEFRFNGPMKAATSTATKPANSAESASLASRVASRRSAYRVNTPISTPMKPAVAISSQGSRHSPATAAEVRPNENAMNALSRRRIGRSSWRSAVCPWAMLIWPLATASAIRSAAASLCRSLSPGPRRMTRVMSEEPIALVGSEKLRINPVGLDQGSQSSTSCWDRATTAASNRCAVVP